MIRPLITTYAIALLAILFAMGKVSTFYGLEVLLRLGLCCLTSLSSRAGVERELLRRILIGICQRVMRQFRGILIPIRKLLRKVYQWVSACLLGFDMPPIQSPRPKLQGTRVARLLAALGRYRSRLEFDHRAQGQDSLTGFVGIGAGLLTVYSILFSQIVLGDLTNALSVMENHTTNLLSLSRLVSNSSKPGSYQVWGVFIGLAIASFVWLYKRETVEIRPVVVVCGLLGLSVPLFVLNVYSGFYLAELPVPEIKVTQSLDAGLDTKTFIVLGQDQNEEELLSIDHSWKVSDAPNGQLLTISIVRKDRISGAHILRNVHVFEEIYSATATAMKPAVRKNTVPKAGVSGAVKIQQE